MKFSVPNVSSQQNFNLFFLYSVARVLELYGAISCVAGILGCLIGGFADRKLRAHSPSAGLSFSGFCMTISAVTTFMNVIFIQYLGLAALFVLNFVGYVLANCMWAMMGQVFLVSTTLCIDDHTKMNASNVRES